MESCHPKMNSNKYLSSFSLNFFSEKDEQLYSQSIYLHKKTFFKFMIFWIIFMFICISCLQSDIFSRANDLIPLLVFPTLAILMYFLIQKVKNGFVLEIVLASIILTLNIFIVEYAVPRVFERLKIEQDDSDLKKNTTIIWMCLFVGIHLRTLNSIMASAKIRWFIVSASNLIVDGLIFRNFVFAYKLNSPAGILMTLILPSFILPIFITYIDEKKIKELFINLKRAKQNLSGFEDLIENIIPCQIIILNDQIQEVLYCNSLAKSFFKILDNNKQILLEKLKNINLNEKKINFLEFSKILINKKKDSVSIEESLKGMDEVYNCSYKNERDEIYFLDIQCSFGHWQNLEVILIVLNDISFKMQSLNQINQYKDMILASISHNLRTPLNSLFGSLELAAEEMKKDKINCSEYICTAQSSCKTLLSLINDILDFSQLSNNTLHLNIEEFFIYETINEVLEIISIQIKKKKLNFLCSFCKEIEAIKIKADRNRFQQILLNLIENAIKYTFKGQIIFTVIVEQCVYHHNDHNVVVFKIIDTGIGIEKKRLEDIFGLYKNIDSKNENRECLGFGLSISQHLAKAMHEEGITVKSTLNEGSEFRFSLFYKLEATQVSEESPFLSSFQEKSKYNLVRFDEEKTFGQQYLKK